MPKRLPKTKQPFPNLHVRVPTTTRFSIGERAHLKAMAKKYTGGNLSEWIRYAALYFKPRKRDLV